MLHDDLKQKLTIKQTNDNSNKNYLVLRVCTGVRDLPRSQVKHNESCIFLFECVE